MTRHLALIALFALATLGCPGPGPAEPEAVAVSISPDRIRLTLGNSLQFTATVTGTMNRAVDWTVSGAGCSGAACGTIDANGLYTAPDTLPAEDRVTVTARARADENASAEASLTIGSLVSVLVTPSTRFVEVGSSQRFSATVTGSANTAVFWTVEGDDCDAMQCGDVDDTGLYRAPDRVPIPTRIIVAATAYADQSRSGSANVTVTSSTIDHRAGK
jgi:hypothetical protein